MTEWTPEIRLCHYKAEWQRQIISVTGDDEEALHIVQLAELNGLFDVVKVAFAHASELQVKLEKIVSPADGEKADKTK